MKKTKLEKARKIKQKLENRLNTNKFESTTAKRLFIINEKLLELEFFLSVNELVKLLEINKHQKKHV